MTRNYLLACGVFSSLLYTAMNIFIPAGFDGYNWVSQTVSELSAIQAPTRTVWVIWAMVYILLFGAFGWGVRKAAGNNRHLCTVSLLILIYVIVNFYWPPMHLRGNAPTFTDTLHIAWAIVTILLMMLIMGFGAAALGNSFRLYTFISFIIFIVFGILIGREAPGIAANTPTPYIGLWERLNIGVFMIWVMVFASALLKRTRVLLRDS